MLKPIAALAALALAAPAAAPASSPTQGEALRCWLMTHPNQAPLPVEHWPALNRGRSRYS